ncbi:hypothetical protein SAMN05421863_10862 [Nitrosomonas communis]|uniref:Uncharacterized protein n=1 Tax=Nitrosomonas communis TaxID=44574 RepID=A0A1I4VL40_9PROT|nr:hypothetical protein SAMN05421863_10862 [Nitrosomonas communis]
MMTLLTSPHGQRQVYKLQVRFFLAVTLVIGFVAYGLLFFALIFPLLLLPVLHSHL